MKEQKHGELRGRADLHRGLDNRHVQLIALGGAIGTGLFMGSGKTISVAGPSIMLIYAIIGFMLFFVMRAMGELLLAENGHKSFVDFSNDFLGPWFGFFMGWTYWLCWVVTAIADIVAIVGYAHFWWPDLPPWLIALSCVVLFLALNIVAVKLFGELEFWFALIKIIAILALILAGFYMVFTGFVAPNGIKASFAHVWRDGSLFPNGVSGFFAGFQIAVFSFVGIELVGIAAAEVKKPHKTLPRAINAVPVRVILFYIVALFAIMSVTPWREILPDRSPFVHMFVLLGIPIAAGLVNFVVLTSAASSANSGVFSTSRMLYGLAEKGGAIPILGRLTSYGVPVNGLIFSCGFIFIAYLLLAQMPTVMEAFTVVTSFSAILFMFVWGTILLSYLAYRKKCPQQHERSIYKMPGGRFMCYVVLAFFAFIFILLALQEDTRKALYVTPFWLITVSVLYKMRNKVLG